MHPGWSWLASSERGQVLVHELHRHRPLTDGARDALHGPIAHVTGDEDARHARFEKERLAVDSPSGWWLALVERFASREDEPGLFAQHRSFEPIWAWRLADGHDEPRQRRRPSLPAS